jgi:hypothetical protein
MMKLFSNYIGILLFALSFGLAQTAPPAGLGGRDAQGNAYFTGNVISGQAQAILNADQCVAASNSGTAYTCSTVPTFVPASGSHVRLKVDIANTGSATLAVNGTSAATIKKLGGASNLSASDLYGGQWISLIYDGTYWQVDGQVAASANATTINSASVPASASVISSNGSSQLTSASTTGTGNVVLATSPTLVTPTIGVASATSETLTGALPTSSTAGLINYGTQNYSDSGMIESYQASTNGYIYNLIENTSNGALASACYQVGNASTTVSTGYGELCMNGTGYTGSGEYNAANATLLDSVGGDLGIGTVSANAIHFFVNAGATDSAQVNGTTGVWNFKTNPVVGTAGSATGTLTLSSSTPTGSVTLTPAPAASAFTMTIPAATDTLAALGVSQTFSAANTFSSATTNFGVAGSTTGILKVNSSGSGGSVSITPATATSAYTATLPANTGTMAELNIAQTFTQPITISPTASLVLGTAGSAVGQAIFNNATSGTVTVAPPTGALGTVTATLPIYSGGLPPVFSCGSTGTGNQTCSPAAVNGKQQIYVGQSTLATNAATITFPNTFTSTTSYFCVANDVTTRTNPVQMVPASGTTATITDTTGASDVVQWMCVGN